MATVMKSLMLVMALALAGTPFAARAEEREDDSALDETDADLRGPCEIQCADDFDRYSKFCDTMTGRARRSCHDEALRILQACVRRCP